MVFSSPASGVRRVKVCWSQDSMAATKAAPDACHGKKALGTGTAGNPWLELMFDVTLCRDPAFWRSLMQDGMVTNRVPRCDGRARRSNFMDNTCRLHAALWCSQGCALRLCWQLTLSHKFDTSIPPYTTRTGTDCDAMNNVIKQVFILERVSSQSCGVGLTIETFFQIPKAHARTCL